MEGERERCRGFRALFLGVFDGLAGSGDGRMGGWQGTAKFGGCGGCEEWNSGCEVRTLAEGCAEHAVDSWCLDGKLEEDRWRIVADRW